MLSQKICAQESVSYEMLEELKQPDQQVMTDYIQASKQAICFE